MRFLYSKNFSIEGPSGQGGGLYSVFHHVDAGYLSNYLNEFEFRFNRRKISDAERFAALVGQTQRRVGWYCQTPQPQNAYAYLGA